MNAGMKSGMNKQDSNGKCFFPRFQNLHRINCLHIFYKKMWRVLLNILQKSNFHGRVYKVIKNVVCIQ